MPNDTELSSKDRTGPLGAWIRAASDVTEILGSARSLSEASSDILRAVGERLECDTGTLWLPEAASRNLVAHRVWTREVATAVRPAKGSSAARVEPGLGAAGRAFALRRPIWSHDLTATPDDSAGGFATPLLYGDVCYGVLEFGARDLLPPASDHRVAAGQLGKQIGQFVARETAFADLLRHRRDLTDLFENAPVGVHLLDREGRILRANRAELEMLGYSREEYVGRLWREFHVDPSAADAMLKRLADAEAGTEVPNDEAQLRAKSGAIRWMQIAANVLREDGRFVHVRGFLRDVTERKEASLALRASEERYRLMVEGARDYAIHALDAEGRVLDWNVGAGRLFGHDAKDVLGADFSATFTPEDRAGEVPSRLLRLAADEGEFAHEGLRVRKDGSRFWAEVVYSAMRDESGRIVGIRQLTRDVSERRRLEALRRKSADLESANRTVLESSRRTVELLRSVAATVEGPAAEFEAAAARLDEARRDGASAPDLRMLEAALASLRKAIQGLGALATEAVAQADVSPEPVDLHRIASDTREMLRDAAAERRVRVDIDVDPALTDVVADRDRLRQVLYNFLSNAVRFCRERGRVSLRLSAEGPTQFRLEVEDTGLGIPPDRLDRVFLGRVDGAKEETSPRGVGLPATRRIVEQQGGRVGAASTLGRGSVFFAILPRTPRAPAEADGADGSESAASGPPGAVLVVSGDPATRASLAWTLGREGLEAVHAGTAEEALDLARERSFDAIAIDLLLEGMGAVDFAAILRSGGASRAAPCIVGALGSREDGAAGLPAADLIPRPAPADRLFAALERARVPRGGDRTILLVDESLPPLEATARALTVLGYRARIEPNGDAALKTCAEAPPAAVVLSPFLSGLDCFSFLVHLRRLPGMASVPVILSVPREIAAERAAALVGSAGAAARERLWPKTVRGLLTRNG